ncbi:AAA family ATPase [bacterium]|nr:AAA family ATPase [bacterium]
MKFELFTEKARSAMETAQDVLGWLKQSQLDTEHLLYGITFVDGSIMDAVFGSAGIDSKKAREKIRELVVRSQVLDDTGGGGTAQIYLTRDAAAALSNAEDEMDALGDKFIGTEHILLAILKRLESRAYALLRNLGLDREKVLQALKELRGSFALDSESGEDKYRSLDRFTTDLTERARQGRIDPIIGRDVEIDRAVQILARRNKNNPVLIGEPGVGKTAIAEGLALRISEGGVPDVIRDKRILALDLAAMIAGSKFRGEFEDRLKAVLDELKGAKRGIVLFIDELHTVVGAGAAEGAMDASNILKPALARGDLQCIGATTLKEYRKYIEKDAALERRFQPIIVSEPSPDEAREILRGLREKYEEHHKIEISNEAIDAAVDLSVRYISGRFLPDKAIDLIDEAAARVRIDSMGAGSKLKELEAIIERLNQESREATVAGEYERAAELRQKVLTLEGELAQERERVESEEADNVVNADDIALVVAQWSGVPVDKMSTVETERYLTMEDVLHEKLIGQDQAVTAVSETIRRAKAGLADPKRPLGSFLFCGPTGVGKTELVKVLAEFLFQNRDAVVRIDMSEYGEKFSTTRLVGAPPGYVGYEEGGQLTEAVRRRPFSILLLDEIEKAHPDVWNVLLQVLDDGRLTDAKGVTVDFKNTVIVMTSNIASGEIAELTADKTEAQLEEGYPVLRSRVMERLKDYFKPELLNRIDEIVVFHTLTRAQAADIARLQMAELAERLDEQGMKLEVTDAAYEHLAEAGYDTTFGARPMRRAIQREVANPIAGKVIAGEIEKGDTVRVDAEKRGIVISK